MATRRSQQGFLVIVAVVLIVVVGFLGVAITFLITGSARSTGDHLLAAQALAIAESGLEKGIKEWSLNAAYAGETTAFASGSFTVTVDADSSSFPAGLGYANPLPANQRHVRSQGQVGAIVRTAEVIVESGGAGGGILPDDMGSKKAKNTSSASWKNPVGAGLDRLIVVGVAIADSPAPPAVTSVTYDGVAMTSLPGTIRTNGTVRVQMFYLVNPNTGNNDVVVNLAGVADIVAGSLSFTGVDATSPIDAQNNSFGSTSPAQVSVITTQANTWIVDTLANLVSSNETPDAPQLQQWNDRTTGGGGGTRVVGSGSIYQNAPVGPVTMRWTMAPANTWAMGAVALRPAAGGGATILSWREEFN